MAFSDQFELSTILESIPRGLSNQAKNYNINNNFSSTLNMAFWDKMAIFGQVWPYFSSLYFQKFTNVKIMCPQITYVPKKSLKNPTPQFLVFSCVFKNQFVSSKTKIPQISLKKQYWAFSYADLWGMFEGYLFCVPNKNPSNIPQIFKKHFSNIPKKSLKYPSNIINSSIDLNQW